MEGLLRVDGKTYRWMGADRVLLKSIVPMADEEAWEADYSRKSQQPAGWMKPGFSIASEKR